MEQKKTFKERCAEAKTEAKKWWKDNGQIILSGVAIFLTGVIVGAIEGFDISQKIVKGAIDSAVDKGVDVGRHDAIDNICNRLADGGEPIRFHNPNTDEVLYIGKVNAPEESEEA